MEPLTPEDLLAIASTVHPNLPRSLLEKMIEFTDKVTSYIELEITHYNVRAYILTCVHFCRCLACSRLEGLICGSST